MEKHGVDPYPDIQCALYSSPISYGSTQTYNLIHLFHRLCWMKRVCNFWCHLFTNLLFDILDPFMDIPINNTHTRNEIGGSFSLELLTLHVANAPVIWNTEWMSPPCLGWGGYGGVQMTGALLIYWLYFWFVISQKFKKRKDNSITGGCRP